MARSPTDTIRFLTFEDLARLFAVVQASPRNHALSISSPRDGQLDDDVSSGGSFHSLGRGGFGGPSGINASGFSRGLPRLRARHRSFEQNQVPPFRCPGSKYIAAPHRLHCFPRLMVNDLPSFA